MPNDNFSADQLLAELCALEKLLTTQHPGSGLTVLCRLIQSSENWAKLLDQHNLEQWLALPLAQDSFPALKHIQNRLEQLSFQKDHDALTGLRNRRAFDRALALEIERSTRAKTPLSLAIIDLDDFKAINDSYGHPCGDQVLQEMASILLQEIRKIDTSARIGGEEFALLLPGTGLARAQKLLARLMESVRQAKIYCEKEVVFFTCSIGVASYRGKAVPDADKLVTEADKALYAAKKAGKNNMQAAPLLDLGQEPDQTLVQHDEKRFLFASFRTHEANTEHKDK